MSCWHLNPALLHCNVWHKTEFNITALYTKHHHATLPFWGSEEVDLLLEFLYAAYISLHYSYNNH